jgi:hypothetical protein
VGPIGIGDLMESLHSLVAKNYRRLLLLAGVVAVVLAVVLVWAEEHNDWFAAQASLVTILLLLALMFYVWRGSRDETPQSSPEVRTYHRAINKLLTCDAIGLFAIVFNAARFDRWQNGIVAKAMGLGILAAGAFFVLGLLLGYLFGLRPTGPSQGSGEKSPSTSPNPPHTNLEEVADWFTKLILGAGLVSLTSLRDQIGRFACFMAKGVDPPPPKQNLDPGSPAFALAIMLFFFASGILYGYLWTRYELAVKNTRAPDTSASADGSPVEPPDPSK